MRLFVASPVKIPVYKEILEEFSPLIKGRWVEEENLHMTWVFLGESDDCEQYLDMVGKISPLKESISVNSLETFGRGVRIFFAKPQTKRILQKIDEFQRAGFKMEKFKPHVTLCRVKRVLDKKAFREKMESYKGKNIGLVTKEIKLYESILQKGKRAFYRHIC